MKKAMYLIMLLILVIPVHGATIHGTVYDLSLNKVDNVVVQVNSTPQQRVISKDGFYSFDLNPGKYKIKATYLNAEVYYAEEGVEIISGGSYVLDLFLFPSFEDENELINDIDISVEDLYEKKGPNYFYLIYFIIFLILIYLIFRFKNKRKVRGKKEVETKEKIEKEIQLEEKRDLNELLEIIKKQGGRTTQKEIRKQIPLSEAKISLMIAELESKGKIRKIKKGRGNIIILNG